MLAALIIVFREVFEAGLIIGIVLAVTRSVSGRDRWIGGGVLAADTDTAWSVALGGFLGLALGGTVCLLTYFGLLRIPARALFTTTTVLIALLAAGMAAQAAAFLERANWLTALDNVVWDSGWLLSDSSIAGRALHTLIGYTDQPTAMQLTVYLAILLTTFVLMRFAGAPVKAAQPART